MRLKPECVPMLADTLKKGAALPAGAWISEGKWDGHRCIVERDTDGVVRLYGRPQRNGESADNTGHLAYLDCTLAQILEPDSCVDGELISPRRGVGGGRAHVQSVMFRRHPHVPSAVSPALQLVMFDVLRLAGEDLRSRPWHQRRSRLEQLAAGPHVAVSPVLPVEHALAIALETGLEGVVYKRRDGLYVNRRSKAWLKAKFVETCEAVIRGFKAGKAGGQWDGKVGAFEVEVLDGDLRPAGVFTTVKCGTDARHLEATDHPERWFGAIIELRHLGFQESGVPLSPQFGCRRDDLLLLEANRQAA